MHRTPRKGAGGRALRLLIVSIGGLAPDAARARAISHVQQLPLDLQLKDFVLRVLDKQRSTEGLVDTLWALVGLLDSKIAPRPLVSHPPITRLPVWPHLDDETHFATIPASDVVYAFTGGAMAQGFISAPWRLDVPWHEQGVYLRVNRFKDRDPRGIGVLATPYRTLRDLRARLDPRRFLLANQSTVVNIDYIHYIGTSSPVDLRIVFPDRTVESLQVSRRCWPELRPLIGLTARASRRPAAADG